ncbi:hypothetical protein FRACYDRAFT_247728 [Fragilariopsis cylindrus CCMP1102]|uniref:Transmembrane protein n=1 Tax=Fragilariopsis cylindrus CCMP1102 TaxID=635003 RepID=A0A1E7EWC0_9STRA|nr:hypothetical protein FRACYDRAFT_247728 [Fragilariopsis cylindrus CCMP1102]|eukprot:OEU10114.1 hypothetical protein FRACYDRAFT_247728 [Fragilariopsis cylindrus CCMP1102]
MVWNAQDAEEKQESEEISRHGFCYNFSCAILSVPRIFVDMFIFPVFMSLVCIFILVLLGPTLVFDFLFFWKRQALRKQLISTSVPVELHIVHRRQDDDGNFFVRLGYQMDNNVSYVAKNEEQVTEQMYKLTKTKSTRKIRIDFNAPVEERSLIWNNGIFLGNVSSSYPSSGPCHPESFSVVCGLCLCGLIFAAFETFILAMLTSRILAPELDPEPTTICYLAVAGVLFFIGFLSSACKFAYTTLHRYEVVDELRFFFDDDDDDNDDDKNNDGLEMGMLAVQEDDDTETLAFTEEYISSDEEDEMKSCRY